MEELKRNKPIGRFRRTIESFCSNASGSNLAEIQKWLSNHQEIERLHSNLKKEQIVTTLLSPETPRKLHSFFYPLKVIATTTQVSKDLKELVKINGTHGTLINGRLGQGKSILLRYLQYLELNTGESIPIFVELRKVKSAGSLLDASNQILGDLGLKCSNKLFNFFLSEGHVSLFFDGFDEVSLDERSGFNEEFSRICSTYTKTKITLTSRHNTEVTTNKHFKNYHIAPLDRSEFPLFIKKILGTEEIYTPILRKIDESNGFDFTVLDSPLLATWFIIVYNKRLKIPKTKLGFYEDLFEAILSRHDGMKESHNRDSKSQLSDDEIRIIFCCICFLSRKDEITTFSRKEILDYIQRALNTCSFSKTKPTDYLYDLTHITCLLKKDGLDYEFIHESIVQYYSASFIANSTEENVKNFYTKRVKDWKLRESELSFLEDIDSVRFYLYFYIPCFWEFMGSKKVPVNEINIKKEHIENIFPNPTLAFADDEKKQYLTVFPIINASSYIVADLSTDKFSSRVAKSARDFVERKLLPKVLINYSDMHEFLAKYEFMKAGNYIYLNLLKVLKDEKMTHEFYESLKQPIFSKLSEKLNKAIITIENEAKKKDLYD